MTCIIFTPQPRLHHPLTSDLEAFRPRKVRLEACNVEIINKIDICILMPSETALRYKNPTTRRIEGLIVGMVGRE